MSYFFQVWTTHLCNLHSNFKGNFLINVVVNLCQPFVSLLKNPPLSFFYLKLWCILQYLLEGQLSNLICNVGFTLTKVCHLMSPGIFFFQKGEAFSLISFLFQSISAALLVFILPILPCPIRSLLPHVRPPRIVMKPKEVTNLLGERRRREGFGRGSLLKKIYDQI